MWGAVGQSRVIHTADGGSMHEELVIVDPPRRFSYRLTEVTGPLKVLVGSIDGSWSFEPVGTGTRIEWSWAIHPLSDVAALALRPVGRSCGVATPNGRSTAWTASWSTASTDPHWSGGAGWPVGPVRGWSRPAPTPPRRAVGKGRPQDGRHRLDHDLVIALDGGAERPDLDVEPGGGGGVERRGHVRTGLAGVEGLDGELGVQRHPARLPGGQPAPRPRAARYPHPSLGSMWQGWPPPTMVEPEDALPGQRRAGRGGRRARRAGCRADAAVPEGSEWIVLGMGCFWGAERTFWELPGVVSTAVGYAGGHTPNPTYDEVCSGRTGSCRGRAGRLRSDPLDRERVSAVLLGGP